MSTRSPGRELGMPPMWILSAVACLISPASLLAQNRKGQNLAGIWEAKGQTAVWSITPTGAKRYLLTGHGGVKSEPARMIIEIGPGTYSLKKPEPPPSQRYDSKGRRLAGLDSTLHLNGDILKLDGWAIINGKRTSQVHTTLHRKEVASQGTKTAAKVRRSE